MKWKPLRIWDWRLKLVYVIVAWGLGWALVPLVRLTHDPGVLRSAYDVAIILFGARVFRGAGEQVDAPRVSWRMTSRPTMSRRFGKVARVLAVLTVVFIPILYLSELVPREHPLRPLTPWDGITLGLSALEFAVIAFLYLRSARRLGWREAPAPKLAPPISLGE